MKSLLDRFFVAMITSYIRFVYRTSKIILHGETHLLREREGEKLVGVFWHGDSYSLIPSLEGTSLYILTTENRRGDYISAMVEALGYTPLRVPDLSDGGNHIFRLRRAVSGSNEGHLMIALDGPLGPWHVPKDFPIVTAYMMKRRLMPITVSVRRKLTSRRRWDRYILPLPWGRIDITFHPPLEVTSQDKADQFGSLKDRIRRIMED